MSDLFTSLDADAIVVEAGVYKPVALFGGPTGGLYAKLKGGFIRLNADNTTSHERVRLHRLFNMQSRLFKDEYGRLLLHPRKGVKRVRVIHAKVQMCADRIVDNGEVTEDDVNAG